MNENFVIGWEYHAQLSENQLLKKDSTACSWFIGR
jgi:hypothetical protein